MVANDRSQIVCAFVGLVSDARMLEQLARQEALRYRLVRQKDICVSKMQRRLSTLRHGFTLDRKLRPLGCTLLCAGYDQEEGYKLISSEVYGHFKCWKAAAYGSSSNTAQDALESEYDDELDWQEACRLACEALNAVGKAQREKVTIEAVVLRHSESEGTQMEFLNDTQFRKIAEPDMIEYYHSAQ